MTPPCQSVPRYTPAPMAAPAIAPGIVTVRAAYPAALTAMLRMTAGISLAAQIAVELRATSSETKLKLQSTSAADAGTEMLSFNRIGAVSMKPATRAASAGAMRIHQSRVSAPAVQAASALPASQPNTMNAAR